MRNTVCIMGLLLVLLCPAGSFAAMQMLVTPNGDGAFFIEGDNIIGVEAMDITIDYDTTSLAHPRVTANGGTLTNVYANTPGTLLVNVFRENPDAAFELDLRFEKKGDLPGVINQVTATVRDTTGKSFPVPALTYSPPPGPSDEPRGEPASRVPGAAKLISFDEREKSVLQRFREFKGEKGLQTFSALFKRNDGKRIAQDPAIALSDGKTPVVIRLQLQAEGNHSPDIALLDAKLVSVQKVDEKSWVITVLPGEGAWEARLALGTGKEMVDFPLVVAPLVKIQGGINDQNFLAALNKYLSDQAAGRTSEGGTFKQALCEYIFTANYLANPATAPPRKASW